MRWMRWSALVLLLALAACGVPTDNSSTSEPYNNAGTADGALVQPSAADMASAPAASVAAAASAAGAAADDNPAERNNKYSAAPQMQIDPNKTYTATIETTKGTLTAELDAKDAPMTVNNFVFLARDGFYKNVKFHRIIKNFMVQTGDPTGTGTGGPGYQFNDEPVKKPYTRGTLAMANAGPNTNGSQFFIVHQDYPLPPNYTIFGTVTGGLDVLDALANTPTTGSEGSTPTEDVRIVNVTINEK